jgi:hypothetical protein
MFKAEDELGYKDGDINAWSSELGYGVGEITHDVQS